MSSPVFIPRGVGATIPSGTGAPAVGPRVRAGRGAFTLIELLVVLSILAILMGIIVPTYFRARENPRITKAQAIVKHLELAYSEYYNYYNAWPAGGGGDVANTLSVLIGANPDSIPFFEIGSNTVATFKDPWGNAYNVAFDDDFNYEVVCPANTNTYRKTVIVWTAYTNAGEASLVGSW